MSNWNTVLTSDGKITAARAQGSAAVFSRADFCSALPSGDYAALTTLGNILKTGSITQAATTDGTRLTLTADNSSVSSDTTVYCIALYSKMSGDDEKLYAVIYDTNGTMFPAYSATTSFSFSLELSIGCSDGEISIVQPVNYLTEDEAADYTNENLLYHSDFSGVGAENDLSSSTLHTFGNAWKVNTGTLSGSNYLKTISPATGNAAAAVGAPVMELELISDSTIKALYQAVPYSLYESTTVTLSFFARVSSGTGEIKPYVTRTKPTAVNTSAEAVTLTADWRKIEITAELPTSTSGYIYAVLDSRVCAADITVEFAKPKLEIGRRATKYYMSPRELYTF